jgi:hypothetical protein
MKSIFRILTLVLTVYTLGANAQVKKPAASPVKKPASTTPAPAPAGLYNITELSFFNPAHIALLEKQVIDQIPNVKTEQRFAYRGDTSSYTGKIFSRSSTPQQFLTSEFRPLGNKWFYVVEGKKGELMKRDEYGYNAHDGKFKNKLYPIIALNDSIYVLADGTLTNIFDDYPILSDSKELENRVLSVITNKIPSEQYLLARGDISNSEIDASAYNKERFYSPDGFNSRSSFNLLSDRITFKQANPNSLLATDNRFSNYLLSDEFDYDTYLFNRYNVEDTIHASREFVDLFTYSGGLPRTYNDSLLVVTVPLNPAFSGASKQALGSLAASALPLNSNYLKDSIAISMASFAKNTREKTDWLNTLDPRLNRIEESKKYVADFVSAFWFKDFGKTLLFENVYNFNKKGDQLIYSKDLEQRIKTANKFISYDPQLLVVFNYRTNKLISVLNRNGLPFNQLQKLLIDKSNTLLIAQSFDNVFSIFDLRNGKEVLSAKGIINHISDDNKLMLNFSITSKSVYQASLEYTEYIDKLSGYSLSLTELIQKNNVYYSNFTESLNVDEFTSSEDFNAKIATLGKTNRSAFFAQEKKPNNQPLVFAKPYQPDNKTIKNTLQSQINKFVADQGPIPADIRLPLNYTMWDPNTKILTLSTKQLPADTVAYLGAKWEWEQNSSTDEVFLLEEFRTFNKFRGAMQKEGSISFELDPVEPEQAKKIKDGSIKLTFILRNQEVNFPHYQYIYANRFYKTIYDRYGGYDKLNVDGKLDKYFEKTYQLKRTQLNFYDHFFMEENETEIPLQPNAYKNSDWLWIRFPIRNGDPLRHTDGYPKYNFFQFDN